MVTSVSVSMRRCQSSGSPWSIALVSENSLVGLPSIMYEATVNGPPANPTTAVVPSSSRRTSLMASNSSGVASRGIDDPQRGDVGRACAPARG